SAALAAAVDDRGHSRRRWRVVVRHWSRDRDLRRPGTLLCTRIGSGGGGTRHRDVSQAETGVRTKEALRTGTALLGHAVAARPILLPVGPYHYRVRRCGFARLV